MSNAPIARIVRPAAILAVALALLAPEIALANEYSVDKVHSTILFSIRHLVAEVQGKFTKFDGKMVYDEKNPSASSVDFTVDAASIDTNNERRDGHLRSPDFFDVAKFPTLTFKSEKVVAKGKDTFEVTGPLTMRGVTKTVTVPVKVLGLMDTKEFGRKAGFQATFTLNRKDYGIVWNKTLDAGGLVLGDDVTVTINLEADGKK